MTGILRGPEDAAERQWWNLLEDPFSGEVDHLGKVDEMEFIPALQRIEPTAWIEEADIAPRLAGLCEERRHYIVTEDVGWDKEKSWIMRGGLSDYVGGQFSLMRDYTS